MVMPLVYVLIKIIDIRADYSNIYVKIKLFWWGDITVKSMFIFMLNKRKCKRAANWGSYQRSPRPPCCHRRGTPSSVPFPAYEIVIRPPSRNPGSAPANHIFILFPICSINCVVEYNDGNATTKKKLLFLASTFKIQLNSNYSTLF